MKLSSSLFIFFFLLLLLTNEGGATRRGQLVDEWTTIMKGQEMPEIIKDQIHHQKSGHFKKNFDASSSSVIIYLPHGKKTSHDETIKNIN
ncbi:hypothetical protein RND81_09G175500 [Saponaria officinalis]|uniref:Uncharacterized protein n=1 Tax=Saponaria officinalis TaxID=3572 RepID=A0AAW1IN68_SAPOF